MVLTRQQLEELDRASLLDYAEKTGSLSTRLKSLEDKFEKFQGEFNLMKNANSLLKTRADNADSRIEFLEKELTRTAQYTLNRQLELHRVPATIGSDDYADETLKNTVCEALSLTGVAVTPEQIDKCHRLKKKTSVVLEFKQRVQRDPILHSKRI